MKEAEKGSAHLEAARILAHAAGVYGIVAGQSADLLWSDVKAGESELLFLYANKTGRMFRAPLAMAACLAKGDVPLWSRFGERLGILFQLTDDLLDRGAAGEEKRLTAVKVYGLARAEELASSCAQECCALAQRLGAPFLRDLAEEIERRKA